MLKEIKKSDIVSMVLLNGQELICKYVEKKDDVYVIHQPLTLVMSQEGAAFQQYTMTGKTEGNVEINANMVVAVVETQDELAKNYKEATSGLILPN